MSIDMTDAHFESIIQLAREIRYPTVEYSESVGAMKDSVIKTCISKSETMIDILREYED